MDLTSNMLKKIPKELNLLNLTHLYLGDNKIEIFKAEFINSENLQVLHIDRNYFTKISKEFMKFERLEELKLDW